MIKCGVQLLLLFPYYYSDVKTHIGHSTRFRRNIIILVLCLYRNVFRKKKHDERTTRYQFTIYVMLYYCPV